MDWVKRWATYFLAATVGAAGAAGYALFMWPDSMLRAREMSASDAEWVKMASAMEVCCVFFGLIYGSGRFFARMLRAPALDQEVKQRARWHMMALHFALGAILVTGRAFTQPGGSGWNAVMIGVGIGLMLFAALVFVRGLKRSEAAL